MAHKNSICDDCLPPEVSAEILAAKAGRKVAEILAYKESGIISSKTVEKGTAWQREVYPLAECLEKIKVSEKAETP
jgi:hypothetical protein